MEITYIFKKDIEFPRNIMALDDILKPINWLDEQILRQHAKVAKFVHEKTGIDRHDLGDRMGLVSTIALAVCFKVESSSSEIMGSPDTINPIEETIRKYLNVMMGLGVSSYSVPVLMRKDPDNYVSEKKAYELIVDAVWGLSKVARLPAFLGGLTGMAYSVSESISSGYWSDNLGLIVVSSMITLGASALYIKDADPKVLKKESALKTAYTWLGDRLTTRTPQTNPQESLIELPVPECVHYEF